MTTTESTEPTESLDPFNPAHASNPQPYYKRLRDECPVHAADWAPNMYFLSRYEDVMWA